MRLLLIRHGDPDYEKDGLTAVGRREAELLAERIAPMDVAAYYVSTMGRASETARYTLEKAGREDYQPLLTGSKGSVLLRNCFAFGFVI